MTAERAKAFEDMKRSLRSAKRLTARSWMTRHTGSDASFRPMHRFSPIQREKLLNLFAANRYPSTEVKRNLAEEFNVSIHRISCWFNEKRRARNNMESCGSSGGEGKLCGNGEYLCVICSVCFRTNRKSCSNFSRQLLSKRQYERLSTLFEKKKYISATEQAELCSELGLTESQITNWFVHRRHRLRKSALGVGAKLGERELFSKFSPIQLTEFLHFFNKPVAPSKEELTKVASELDVPIRKVINWFNRRANVPKIEVDFYDIEPGLVYDQSPAQSNTASGGGRVTARCQEIPVGNEITERQLEMLEIMFEDTDEVAPEMVTLLSKASGLTQDEIVGWFRKKYTEKLMDSSVQPQELNGMNYECEDCDFFAAFDPNVLCLFSHLFNVSEEWV
ncbi:Double homeobox protein A [Trichinella britovi]|uniref:Double homeobox protein A n=1 Tax=Trichinella britovi TaxID=45882 RepID=A0A0V1CT39_TRIBR|nr:Double homeobox protein A [Trichinella britovi]